jgi:cell division protein FtsW (lipid II flippase)
LETPRAIFFTVFFFSPRSGSWGLGSGLLTGGALQFLPFQLVFNLGGVCHLVPLSLKSLPVSRKLGGCDS